MIKKARSVVGNLKFSLFMFASLLILLTACQKEVNPDDPDLERDDLTVQYYSKMRITDLNFFYFEESDLLPDFETASENIRFYQVFYSENGSIYKIKEYFEKVGGEYPRLFAYYKPEYNENNQLETLSNYQRYGDAALLFVLVSQVKLYYNARHQLEKKELYEYWPLLTDHWRQVLDEKSQGDQVIEEGRLAMEIFFDKGLEKKRTLYEDDGTFQTIYYFYDGAGNRSNMIVFNDQGDSLYEWEYNEDGYGTQINEYTSRVQWETQEIFSDE